MNLVKIQVRFYKFDPFQISMRFLFDFDKICRIEQNYPYRSIFFYILLQIQILFVTLFVVFVFRVRLRLSGACPKIATVYQLSAKLDQPQKQWYTLKHYHQQGMTSYTGTVMRGPDCQKITHFLVLSSMTQTDFATVLFSSFSIFLSLGDLNQWSYKICLLI